MVIALFRKTFLFSQKEKEKEKHSFKDISI